MRIHIRKFIFLSSAFIMAFSSLSAWGAIYMCGPIEGDATASGYANCIAIDSFQDGLGRSIAPPAAGGDASSPYFSEIILSKQMDKATVLLRREAAVGTPKDWTIHFVSTGGAGVCEYYKVQALDARLSSHSMSSGGDRPMESFSLAFNRIIYTYYVPNGEVGCGTPVEWGYDLRTDKEL